MDGSGTKDYIPTLMLSREEALVHTITHELRHVWQVMTESVWDRLPLEETQGTPPRSGLRIWMQINTR